MHGFILYSSGIYLSTQGLHKLLYKEILIFMENIQGKAYM